MLRGLCILVLAFATGCGIMPARNASTTPSPTQDTAESIADESLVTDPSTIRTPGGSSALSGTNQPGAGDLYADELTSLFLDAMFLDLLNPAGPALSLTYLERLCLEGGEPDYICRQRFGN